jgi:hypothetical protein
MVGRHYEDHAASPITYTPINATSSALDLLATIGPAERIADAAGNMVVSYAHIDFSVTAADMVVNGSQFYPQRGDVIAATIGTTRATYEVRANDLKEVWDWTDSSKTRFRIHTNLKASS